jgi:hypothetical protein
MEALIGIIVFIFLIGFVVWRQKCDREKYGAPTTIDRRNALLYGMAAFTFPCLLVYVESGAYIIASIVIFIFYRFVGVGGGNLGWYRQLRDGVFIAWVTALFPSL